MKNIRNNKSLTIWTHNAFAFAYKAKKPIEYSTQLVKALSTLNVNNLSTTCNSSKAKPTQNNSWALMRMAKGVQSEKRVRDMRLLRL